MSCILLFAKVWYVKVVKSAGMYKKTHRKYKRVLKNSVKYKRYKKYEKW